ncbi:hypothetical protein [Planococcus koreensis]
MSQEVREDMIKTMSVMLCRHEAYYKDMNDRRLAEEYDRFMKME